MEHVSEEELIIMGASAADLSMTVEQLVQRNERRRRLANQNGAEMDDKPVVPMTQLLGEVTLRSAVDL